MVRVSKDTAAIALVMGASAMTAACGGHGPNSYLMPKDAVVAKLSGAEREYEFLGNQQRSMQAVSWKDDRLLIKINGAGRGNLHCYAVVETINEDWTRVNPDCGKGDNATEQAERELLAMQVDEFVIAVLYDKPIDESMVLKRTSAVVIDNLPDAMREEEQQRAQNRAQNYSAAAPVDDGWGDSDGSGSDWGS